MNILLRLYLAFGLSFILGVYVVTLSLWFESAVNGALNGQYVVTIDTNILGESGVVLLLLFLFLPVVAWMFTRGLRQVLIRGARA